MKIAVVTCYKQPNYVRAQTLRAAVATFKNHELIVIKNSHKGFLRYPEIIYKTLVARLKHRPDVYVITFRGYEILPALNLLTWPKKLIFDEFINPLEWLHEPRPEVWAKLIPKSLLRAFYRLLLHRPKVVLADTEAHAAYSAQLTYGKSNKKFVSLPVSTDESLFRPAQTAARGIFRVFYYGNMLPLHGLEHVLEAAVVLKDQPIEFLIVGGNAAMQAAVQAAIGQGAHITYKKWLDYQALPAEIYRSHLCLGGPFGDTKQAQMVITGKTYQFLACAAPTLIGANEASELFVDKKNCLTVPLGDSKALSKAIEWAYQHPKELKIIGENGRVLYQQHFSITAIAPQLELILGM